MKKETIAYVYKWTHIPTLKWYVGSRTAKGCYPDDGYICSSKIVKPMIESNPSEWRREIIAIGDKIEMRELEYEILTCLQAAQDVRSFNQYNGSGPWRTLGSKMSEEHKRKISESNKGRVVSEEQKQTHSKKLKGRKLSKEHKRKISEGNKGRIFSEEHRKNISKNKIGEKNPAFGKSIRKGIPHTKEVKELLSQKNKGRIPSKEQLENQRIGSLKRKGICLITSICPHCNKEGGAPQMKRWHFDNCKSIKIIA